MNKEYELNLANVPEELLFLLEIINKEQVEELSDYIKEKGKTIDWKLFLELAYHHRLFPLLTTKLTKIDNHLIPPYIVQAISQTYKENTFHMLFLASVMEEIYKLFTDNRINVVVLKGPILALDLYGDVSLRTSSDLDMLIPIDELEKAEKLLLNLGYVKDDYIRTILNDWKWRHHHITFIHPKTKVKIEIHWRFNPGPAKEPSFAELWERRGTSFLTENPIHILGKEDLFLFLVTHGARHGWSRLRWLMDIHQLTMKKLDWSVVINRLRKYGYLHVGGQAIILTAGIFQTPLVKEMESLVSKKIAHTLAQQAIFYLEGMVNLHTDPVPEHIALYHKQHLFSLLSIRQRLIFISSFLYPYPEDAVVLPLPKSLHFLYFPLRPLLWAWRKAKKVSLS
jgi:hypothetical protein